LKSEALSNVIAALLLLVLVFSMSVSVYFFSLATIERLRFQEEKQSILSLMKSVFYERNFFGQRHFRIELGWLAARLLHVSISLELFASGARKFSFNVFCAPLHTMIFAKGDTIFVEKPKLAYTYANLRICLLCLKGYPSIPFNSSTVAALLFSALSNLNVPFYFVEDVRSYEKLLNSSGNAIVLNAHGEVLPLPGDAINGTSFLQTLRHRIESGLRWVNVGGRAFSYLGSPSGVEYVGASSIRFLLGLGDESVKYELISGLKLEDTVRELASTLGISLPNETSAYCLSSVPSILPLYSSVSGEQHCCGLYLSGRGSITCVGLFENATEAALAAIASLLYHHGKFSEDPPILNRESLAEMYPFFEISCTTSGLEIDVFEVDASDLQLSEGILSLEIEEVEACSYAVIPEQPVFLRVCAALEGNKQTVFSVSLLEGEKFTIEVHHKVLCLRCPP